MAKVTATQINWDGKGNNRTFTRWVKRGQAELTARQMARAYNLDHTEIKIEH